MVDSAQLLADYVEHGSESAFRELVNCFLPLVYSVATRLVDGDGHLAEDMAQTVLVDLAHAARTLPKDVMLGGWLHRHTCFVAAKTMRAERRRHLRERQAVEMNELHEDSEGHLASLAPLLDEAINRLGADDRAAILLRFFEERDFRSIGKALGSTEDAARMRVNRALAKLHLLLRRRGVAISAAALTATLASQAVSAAPAALAVSISTAAFTSAKAASGTFDGLIPAPVKSLRPPNLILSSYYSESRMPQVDFSARLTLAAVEAASPAKLTAELPAHIHVRDARYAELGTTEPVYYKSSSGKVLAIASIKRTEDYRDSLARSSPQAKNTSTLIPSVALALAAIVVIVLFAVVRRCRSG
jgi:RNA polymerase sigma factor (sigma-70 family)